MPPSEPWPAWRLRATAAFVAYAAFMLTITLLILHRDHPPPNLTPFRSIVHDFTAGSRRAFVINFLGNVIAFVPFGLLYPALRGFRSRFWEPVAFCAGFSAIIEVSQFLSGGRVADVDDVLLNTLGGLLGVSLLAAFRGRSARGERESE